MSEQTSTLSTVQNWLIFVREKKCLLRGKNWVFKNKSKELISEILILISHRSGLSLHPWLKGTAIFCGIISFRNGSLPLASNDEYFMDVRVTCINAAPYIINVFQKVWRGRRKTYFKAVNLTAFLNMYSTIQHNEAVEENLINSLPQNLIIAHRLLSVSNLWN